ncbi:MAG TPA: efflux RND transporter permease subunit [Rubricoccaceae bacterium]
MIISDFAIKRPLVTVVVMLSLVLFGVLSLLRLETDEFPEIAPPFLIVGVPYPGGSPDGVEREILDPIEEAVQGISGVTKINGSALDSYAQLSIEFEFSKDPQEASTEVRDAISAIRGDLPAEMEEPIIRRFSPNDLPILSVSLSSETLSTTELTQLADNVVAREIRGVPGVARVDIAGERNRELTINLRPDALVQFGVSPAQVVQAVQGQNLAAPVGRLNGAATEQTIRLEGRIQDVESFYRIPVGRGNGGRAVYLGEVATVEDGAEEARTLALYNGREAVGVDVVKSSDASTTTVANQIIARLDRLEAAGTLPAGTQLDVVRNSGTRVAASVNNVVETLIEGLFLTILVVFVFLNSWRSTVITGLALPVSVLASFVPLWILGFTLNTMSLLGLSLAIGIIIDDAIVVRENIVRHVEMGKDHFRASKEGTDEIGLAVAATTFSIVAVFVPIAFIDGIAGQWFKPFALTIATSVLVSLFVSFSLDPMLSAYWPDPHVPEDKKNLLTRTLDRFNAWFDRQAEGYRRVIGWALDHPSIVVLWALASLFAAIALPASGVIAAGLIVAVTALASVALKALPKHGYVTAPLMIVALVGMGAAIRFAPESAHVGGSFFGEDDRSEIQMSVKTPPGSSLAVTRDRIEQVAAVARAHPEVEYAYATVSSQTGAVDEGSVYVHLVPIAQREKSQNDLTGEIRAAAIQIPGVEVSVSTGFDASKQIQLQLRGTDSEQLAVAADALLARVREVPGTADVGLSTRGRRPEVGVDLDRDAALQRGVSVADVAFSLRPAFAGIDAGDWVDPDGETRDVTVRYGPEFRESAEALQSLPLRVQTAAGPTTISLSEVATARAGLGPAVIQHLDGDPVVSVESNVAQGYDLNGVLAGINATIAESPLPAGVELDQGGQAEDQNEVFTSLITALLSGILLMYLILVLQFNSFLDPLAILVSLPLSLLGVMLGLLIAGSTINIMSMIGVILLMGIVAKNAILLIDFAKELQGRGLSARDALVEAGGIRLRPILMTTFALVAGMVPIAIGSGEGALFRRPLGAAVIGGVITSTILTLIVVPTVYEIFDTWRTALSARVRGVKAPAHGAAGDGATRDLPTTGDGGVALPA